MLFRSGHALFHIGKVVAERCHAHIGQTGRDPFERSLPHLRPGSVAENEQMGGIFFFNDTATTEIYTLSLHDALPILPTQARDPIELPVVILFHGGGGNAARKSTRLNSSHQKIWYAVFCSTKKTT